MLESLRFLTAVALFMLSFREIAPNNSIGIQPENKPAKLFVPTTTTGNYLNPFGANPRAIPMSFRANWRLYYAV